MKAGKLAIWPWLSCPYNEHTLVDLPSSVYGMEKIDQIRNSLTELTLMQVLGATSECLIDEAENFQTRKYVALDSFDHQIKTCVRKSDGIFLVIMFFFAN